MLKLDTGGGTQAVIVSALGWLAWMNVLLGVFNILPAAPLDGPLIRRSRAGGQGGWCRAEDSCPPASAR